MNNTKTLFRVEGWTVNCDIDYCKSLEEAIVFAEYLLEDEEESEVTITEFKSDSRILNYKKSWQQREVVKEYNHFECLELIKG